MSLIPKEHHILLVEFENKQRKKYDVTPLLQKEPFVLLANPTFFRNVHVEQGGYAVVWNEDIDLSECELWTHGMPIS